MARERDAEEIARLREQANKVQVVEKLVEKVEYIVVEKTGDYSEIDVLKATVVKLEADKAHWKNRAHEAEALATEIKYVVVEKTVDDSERDMLKATVSKLKADRAHWMNRAHESEASAGKQDLVQPLGEISEVLGGKDRLAERDDLRRCFSDNEGNLAWLKTVESERACISWISLGTLCLRFFCFCWHFLFVCDQFDCCFVRLSWGVMTVCNACCNWSVFT